LSPVWFLFYHTRRRFVRGAHETLQREKGAEMPDVQDIRHILVNDLIMMSAPKMGLRNKHYTEKGVLGGGWFGAGSFFLFGFWFVVGGGGDLVLSRAFCGA